MPEKKSSRPGLSRTAVITGLCALITFTVLVVSFPGAEPLDAPLKDADNYFQDLLVRTGRLTPANTNLVLIGIDRPSYDDVIFAEDAKTNPVLGELTGRFPWSRRVWAALIEQLARAGAKTIVIDLVFGAENEGDPELHAALEKYGDRVVIGSNFSPVETDRGQLTHLTAPNTTLIPDLPGQPGALDSRVGYVNIWPDDDDDVFRRARFRATNHELNDVVNAAPSALVASLDARAVTKFGQLGKIPERPGRTAIRFTGPPGTWPVISIADVLTPKIWQSNFADGEAFRSKLVLIGPMANIFQDFHRTPFRNEMAGPEIHLQVINAALHGEFLRETPVLANALMIALAGLLTAVLCQFTRAPVKRLLGIFALGGGLFLTAIASFNQLNLIIPIVHPLLVLAALGLATLVYDFVVERQERMKLRHTMGLYFSPRVLEAVLADPGSMEPRRAEVILLLTDLRNSTPLAERLGPKGMFNLLNRVFEAQTGAIMGEEGNLEHFLGDQFLSYWGAPQKQPDGADRASRAAFKLIRSMEDLRATLSPEVQKLFGYGVALHGGGVLVGNKGSALRLDYGLVGDSVNEAARVEALTKYYGTRMLVTRDAFAQFSVQGRYRLIDRVIVKGKSEPVELFECENPCTPSNFPEICARYKKAFTEYHLGRFAMAQELFAELAEECSDGPSTILAARCAELLRQPPKDWHGIWKMDAK
jgi:adenylate cyclase